MNYLFILLILLIIFILLFFIFKYFFTNQNNQNKDRDKAKKTPLCKIITLSKNEYDLIEDFLLYYDSIVGIENIIIIDNNSDDPRVLDIYEKYIKKGLTIETESKNMLSMSEIITNAMIRYKNHATFLMPLDTDEFLFFLEKPHNRRKSFEAVLLSINDNVSVLRYELFLGSIADTKNPDYISYKHTRPARSITKFFNQGWDKLIVRADKFVSISQGNHHVIVTEGIEIKIPLGLLHFHETGSARKKERCIMSMKGYNQIDLDKELHLKTDLWKQLELVDYIISLKEFGGHRVEQYRIFLLREIIFNEIKRLLSRNPESIEEVLELVNDFEPSELEQIILLKNPISSTSVTQDEVVFYEEKLDKHIIEIFQVANFFKNLYI